MTTNQYTETEALAHHGIVAGEGQNLIDTARDAGLIYVCLGCGSIGGIDPNTPLGLYLNMEEARVATKEVILGWDEEAFDCCPDADTMLY